MVICENEYLLKLPQWQKFFSFGCQGFTTNNTSVPVGPVLGPGLAQRGPTPIRWGGGDSNFEIISRISPGPIESTFEECSESLTVIPKGNTGHADNAADVHIC